MRLEIDGGDWAPALPPPPPPPPPPPSAQQVSAAYSVMASSLKGQPYTSASVAKAEAAAAAFGTLSQQAIYEAALLIQTQHDEETQTSPPPAPSASTPSPFTKAEGELGTMTGSKGKPLFATTTLNNATSALNAGQASSASGQTIDDFNVQGQCTVKGMVTGHSVPNLPSGQSSPTLATAEGQIQSYMAGGMTLQQAIAAARIQFGGSVANEATLAQAALATDAPSQFAAYQSDPNGSDPVQLASKYIAGLNSFSAGTLKTATAAMTIALPTLSSAQVKTVQTDATTAEAAQTKLNTDTADHASAATIATDMATYRAALDQELDDVTGQSGTAWFNDPTKTDAWLQGEATVADVNLQQPYEAAQGTGANSAATKTLTGDEADLGLAFGESQALAAVTNTSVPATKGESAAATAQDTNTARIQVLTQELQGLGLINAQGQPTNPTSQEYLDIMDDPSVQQLETTAQANITQALGPSGDACVSNATAESDFRNASNILSEYQGTVFYSSLLSATEKSPALQGLFSQLSAIPTGSTGPDVLHSEAQLFAAISTPSDYDLTDALFSQKFQTSVDYAVAKDHWQTGGSGLDFWTPNQTSMYYTDASNLDAALGLNTNVGANLRNIVMTRMNGSNFVGNEYYGTLNKNSDNYEEIKSFQIGGNMQFFQDIADTDKNTQTVSFLNVVMPGQLSAAPASTAPAYFQPGAAQMPSGPVTITSRTQLLNVLGASYNLPQLSSPTSGGAQYSGSTIVYGSTTLNDLANSTLASQGSGGVSSATPFALTLTPIQYWNSTEDPDKDAPYQAWLEETTGAAGTQYLGPASSESRATYQEWQAHSGFGPGTLLSQQNVVYSADGQQRVNWDQTNIAKPESTGEKIWHGVELGLTIAAVAATTFIAPEADGFLLPLLYDAGQAYFAISASVNMAQSAEQIWKDPSSWSSWAQFAGDAFMDLTAVGHFGLTRLPELLGAGLKANDVLAAGGKVLSPGGRILAAVTDNTRAESVYNVLHDAPGGVKALRAFVERGTMITNGGLMAYQGWQIADAWAHGESVSASELIQFVSTVGMAQFGKALGIGKISSWDDLRTKQPTTPDTGAPTGDEQPPLSPEMEAVLAEAVANFDPNRPAGPNSVDVEAALQRFYDRAAAEAAGGSDSGTGVYQTASSSAQSAFETLDSANGRWTPESWSTMNAYIDEALQSPDPALRGAAENARSVLGDPAGNSRGFILSGPEADALGALIAQDIRATQANPPADPSTQQSPATLTVAETTSPDAEQGKGASNQPAEKPNRFLPSSGKRWQDRTLSDPALRLHNLISKAFGGAAAQDHGNLPQPTLFAKLIAGMPGLPDIFGDSHMHPEPYNGRLDKTFRDILAMMGPHWRGASGSIPEETCAAPHYATADTPDLTIARHTRDNRALAAWKSASPEQQAQIDISLTGVGIVDPDFVPYMKSQMLNVDNFGIASRWGEDTIKKEYVDWLRRFAVNSDLEDPTVQEALKAAFRFTRETGIRGSMHCDMGEPLTGETGRAVPGNQGYQFYHPVLELLRSVANEPTGNGVTHALGVIWAHTGFGREFKGDDTMVLVDRTSGEISFFDNEASKESLSNYRDLIDPNAATVPDGTQPASDQQRAVPLHVALQYKLVALVPDIALDNSWTDVAQSYSAPAMRDGLLQFAIDNPKVVEFGTDAVKPPNAAFYTQTYTIYQPFFNALILGGHADVAWQIIRGNYETRENQAFQQQEDWTTSRATAWIAALQETGPEADRAATLTEMYDANPTLRALSPEHQVQQIQAALDKMATRNQGIRAIRDQKATAAKQLFDDYVAANIDTIRANSATLGADGSVAIIDGPRHDENYKDQFGPADPRGKDFTDETRGKARNRAAGILTAVVGAGALAETPVLTHEPVTDAAAFILRSAANIVVTGGKDLDRLIMERGTEEGRVDEAWLNWFQDRYHVLGPKYGFTEDMTVQADKIMDQLRADIGYINAFPTDEEVEAKTGQNPQTGWTTDQKHRALSAITNLANISIDAQDGIGMSSLDPTGSRGKLGKLLRASVVATFTTNFLYNIQRLVEVQGGVLGMPQHAIFAAADVLLGIHAVKSISDGTLGINTEEASQTMRRLRWMGTGLFTAGMAGLTVADITTNPLGMLYAPIDLGITKYLFDSTKWQYKADQRSGQIAPGSIAGRGVAYLGLLALREIIALVAGPGTPPAVAPKPVPVPLPQPPGNTGQPFVVHHTPTPQMVPATHRVAAGDNMWDVALAQKVSFEELEQLNSWLANPNLIQPGQSLLVPEQA